MSETAYYIVDDGSGNIIGRHHLIYPNGLPKGLDKVMLRRWYPDYPKAFMARDPDQESTATGIYVKRDRYAFERKRRETLRKLLRESTGAELHEVLCQLDPSTCRHTKS